MTELTINHPQPTEYPPYYGRYISLIPQGDVLNVLAQQLDVTLALLQTVSESQAASRYAPDKWSIKELVGHMIDAERIMAYRALRFARGDETPLPGFEQDDYVRNAAFDECSLRDLTSEFEYGRRANLLLFRQFNEEVWNRRGIASDGEVSVRALVYIIAGHERHHTEVLRTKYLS